MGRRSICLVAMLLVSLALGGCVEFFEPRVTEETETEGPTATSDGPKDPPSDPTAQPSSEPEPDDPEPSPEPGPSDEPSTHTVTIEPGLDCSISSYDPAEVTITVGDRVVWKNEDTCPHTATEEDDAWDTKNIDAGATSKAITFDTAGTYSYVCKYHPDMGPAKVVVEA
ncbi:MAG: cupredoxin domain-containing protein [Euryarchaeota archaeon]|nr:cupredoxin domain-containing protein [Euryarchaeota archaeon]